MIGKTVGSYRITTKLGEGGMGAVYRAAEINLGSTVSAGVPRQLFRVAGGITGYDIEPEGQRFLIVTPSAALPDNPITVVLNWWAELKP